MQLIRDLRRLLEPHFHSEPPGVPIPTFHPVVLARPSTCFTPIESRPSLGLPIRPSSAPMTGKREKMLARWRATRCWELPGFRGTDPPDQVEALSVVKTYTPGARGRAGADELGDSSLINLISSNNVAVFFTALRHYRAYFGTKEFWPAVHKAVPFPMSQDNFNLVSAWWIKARREYIAARGPAAPTNTARLVDEWVAVAGRLSSAMPTVQALHEEWRELRTSGALQNLSILPVPASGGPADLEDGEIAPGDSALAAFVAGSGDEGGRGALPAARSCSPQRGALKREGSPLSEARPPPKRRATSQPGTEMTIGVPPGPALRGRDEGADIGVLVGSIDNLRSTVEVQVDHQRRLLELQHRAYQQQDADLEGRISRVEIRLGATALKFESLQSLVHQRAKGWNKAVEDGKVRDRTVQELVDYAGGVQDELDALDKKLRSMPEQLREMVEAEASKQTSRDTELAGELDFVRDAHSTDVEALKAALVSQNDVNAAAVREVKALQTKTSQLERLFVSMDRRMRGVDDVSDKAWGALLGAAGLRLNVEDDVDVDTDAETAGRDGLTVEQLSRKNSELETRLSAQTGVVEGLKAAVDALSARILQLERGAVGGHAPASPAPVTVHQGPRCAADIKAEGDDGGDTPRPRDVVSEG